MGITAFPFSSVIDVPTARILGREDAGTGAAEALTNTEIFAILGTGTPSASTYLRGDGTWAVVSAGVGGSTGSVDNRILRADGTDGAALQTSLVSVNDAGQIQFHGSYSTFNVQLRNPDWGSSHGILLSGLGTVFVTNGGYLWRFEPGVGHLLGVSSSQIQFTSDTRLQRGDAAGILRQFSGTQPQKYELYNTYTSDTSFERLNLSWASNVCYIGTEKGSAGGTARDLTLGTDGAVRLVLPAATTSGALYLGPRADNTTTGGNARGSGAVDLSTTRAVAIQVASGANSFVAPCGGRASGTGSISLSGIATGTNSISHGPAGNTTASGTLSVTFCSDYTTASGNRSFACCGDFMTVSGQGAFGHGGIPGLGGATVAGKFSFGVAGGGSTTSGDGAFSHGPSAVSRLRGMRAFASGRFAENGDVQGAEIVLRNTTTTDSPVTLFVDGTSERLTIPSGKICQFLLIITGVRNGGADVAVYMRRVTIKNIGGTTSLVGAVDTIGTDQATGTSIAITADDTNDALQIAPTGVSGQTWRWECIVYGGEIGHG